MSTSTSRSRTKPIMSCLAPSHPESVRCAQPNSEATGRAEKAWLTPSRSVRGGTGDDG